MSSKFAMNVTQSDMKADEVILCCGNKEKHLYARPQGEWIADNLHNTICNRCGGIRRDNRVDYIAFCNKCGADMKGGAENDKRGY